MACRTASLSLLLLVVSAVEASARDPQVDLILGDEFELPFLNMATFDDYLQALTAERSPYFNEDPERQRVIRPSERPGRFFQVSCRDAQGGLIQEPHPMQDVIAWRLEEIRAHRLRPTRQDMAIFPFQLENEALRGCIRQGFEPVWHTPGGWIVEAVENQRVIQQQVLRARLVPAAELTDYDTACTDPAWQGWIDQAIGEVTALGDLSAPENLAAAREVLRRLELQAEQNAAPLSDDNRLAVELETLRRNLALTAADGNRDAERLLVTLARLDGAINQRRRRPLAEQGALEVRLPIPASRTRSSIRLGPKLPLMPYGKDGRVAHDGQGMIWNLGPLRSFELQIRARSTRATAEPLWMGPPSREDQALFLNHAEPGPAVSLWARDHLNNRYRFPLGALRGRCWQRLRWEDSFYVERFTQGNRQPDHVAPVQWSEIPYLVFERLEFEVEPGRVGHTLVLEIGQLTARYVEAVQTRSRLPLDALATTFDIRVFDNLIWRESATPWMRWSLLATADLETVLDELPLADDVISTMRNELFRLRGIIPRLNGETLPLVAYWDAALRLHEAWTSPGLTPDDRVAAWEQFQEEATVIYQATGPPALGPHQSIGLGVYDRDLRAMQREIFAWLNTLPASG